MRQLLSLILVILICLCPMAASAGAWEEAARLAPSPTEHVDAEDVDIVTSDGYIYITVQKPVTVKIFTILGQIVTQQTLTQGTMRFRLPAKGIYILKIGSATRRITI